MKIKIEISMDYLMKKKENKIKSARDHFPNKLLKGFIIYIQINYIFY